MRGRKRLARHWAWRAKYESKMRAWRLQYVGAKAWLFWSGNDDTLMEMTMTMKTEIKLSPVTVLRPTEFVCGIEAGGLGKNAWVAAIEGVSKTKEGVVQITRKFIDADKSKASPSGNSGTLTFPIPGTGFYEARLFTGVKDGKPVAMDGFLQVTDEGIRIIQLSEMQAWAKVELLRQGEVVES